MPDVTGKYILASRTCTRRSLLGPAAGPWERCSIVIRAPLLRGSGRLGRLDQPLPFPAGAGMAVAHGDQRWVLGLASLDGEAAARPEEAAGGQVDEVRRHPLDGVQLLLAHLVQPGHGLEQAQRIRVSGLMVEVEGAGR